MTTTVSTKLFPRIREATLRRMQGAGAISVLLTVLATLAFLVLATVGFFEGRKAYWDYRVREMCAKDGGIKIYEVVELPADKFNEWGQPNFYKPTQGKESLGSGYVFLSEISYYRKGNPQVARYHIQVIRHVDGKLLGESISYGRGGGDIPSPSYGSSFHCPKEYGDIPLLTRIFNQAKKG